MNAVKRTIKDMAGRKAAIIGLCLLALIGLFPVTSMAADGTTKVYLTKTGKCYHSDGCSSLSKSKIETTLEAAIAGGYTACSKCKPPVLTPTDSKTDNAKTANTAKGDKSETKVTNSAAGKTTDKAVSPSAKPSPEVKQAEQEVTVWLSATGTKYHSKNDCGNMNPDKAVQTTLMKAQAKGYEKCSKCWK